MLLAVLIMAMTTARSTDIAQSSLDKLKQKPRISLHFEMPQKLEYTIRPKARNTGDTRAENCEAKIFLSSLNEDADPQILHWNRNEYTTFAPLYINKEDTELLDVFELQRAVDPKPKLAMDILSSNLNDDDLCA